ncbi:hypothetical protein GBA52_027119 [Prunus armeniaca]|nr:hypothetical protein GBA52_027119 [Prunus armeniaca]
MSESNHQNSMYGSGGAPQSNQVEEQEDDVEESIDNPHIRFEDSSAIPPNPLYLTSSEYPPPAATNGGSDQLTLSFQGEVYVFDEVSPDKVQAVLLLLGGYEIPSGIPSMGPVPLNQQRKKGQFTSSKASCDDGGPASSGAAQGSGQDESMQETSSKSTPMMRRGPAGPRTLCNACGLKWANKGVLTGGHKVSNIVMQDPSAKGIEQGDGEAKDSVAITMGANIAPSSNGDNSAMTVDRNL